ncbi:hypothetical protein PMI15_01582 [Polaromonas sp. CF318]|uniref:hypothetical protein n=1 Tax=Polaromonas sp. CF318 TaxID=1144318 RepID=UPI0002712666|nr:hypothetical protein [Polaromonas sp. CF318]EJL86364.1 hypothetical protein PMI15_01582 [Polaromonas sp. CF318]
MSVRLYSCSIIFAAAGLTGCASITNDTTTPVRFETFNSAGVEVKDVECTLENDYGQQIIKTPVTANVRRSSKDLQVTCVRPGETDGRGVVVSRANAGMAGNILFGGGIGAIIDHNKGTAYTYPQWIQVVMGKLLTFDRKADVDGKPNKGTELPAPVAAK